MSHNKRTFLKMNIKSNLYLIRGILYLNEVIRLKSISQAAEENNIKPSNLSLIINELEKQLNTTLINRSSRGCLPTPQGLQINQYALRIAEDIQNLRHTCSAPKNNNMALNVFISPNLELYDYSEFTKKHPLIKLNFVDDDVYADVKITNTPPKNNNISYTLLTIGSDIKQKVWIACDEKNSIAMKFFDFITGKLLDEYAQ